MAGRLGGWGVPRGAPSRAPNSRRIAVLALAACLALGASACGEDEEPPAAGVAPGATTAATQSEAATAPRDRADETDRDPEPARTEAETEAEETPEESSAPSEPAEAQPRERPRSDPERTLQRVKRVVRTVVSLISAGDPAVCRAFFTQRYADLVSGLEGDRAFRKCESDVEQNKGSLEVTAFGPSSIRDTRAVVKFNLKAEGALTSQQWRLVFSDGHWLVDGKG